MQTVTTSVSQSRYLRSTALLVQVVIRRRLKRRYVLEFFQKLPPCLVGIESCASSQLVARVPRTWLYGATNAPGLREAVCEAGQE
jgi:transposase